MLKQFAEYRENPENILQAFVNGGIDELAKLLGVYPATLQRIFKKNFASVEAWVTDLEKIWRLYHIAVFKQIQSPPVISVAKRSLGYDFRRSQLENHLTTKYKELKEISLLKGFH